MSIFTLVSSIVGAMVFVGAGLVVAITVKRRFFPSWRGSLAVTTVVLIWLSWALAVGQLLGAVGLVRRGALLCAAVISAAGAFGLQRRAAARATPAPTNTEEAGAPPSPPIVAGWEQHTLTVGTVGLVLLVAALWTARTVIAMHRGIMDVDSLGYHLPFIATFAHSGYADQHRLLIPLLPVQFFPANDELLAAMALAITHSMVFAALKNLLYGALVVMASHALGKAFGAGRLAMAAAAVVLGFPVVAFSQPGEAVNDTLLLLVLIGGLAVLAHARDRPAPYVLALACSGIALGVKFSGIVPAASLAAVAVVLLLARVPRHRWRWAVTGLLASAALGGSWYLRNAIDYGNPVPPVTVALGPIHLRTIRGFDASVAYSVAHYAVHGRLLGVFRTGLYWGLGPLFLATFALCGWGAIAAFRSHDGFRVGIAAVALVGALGYLVTPAGAFGGPGAVRYSFVINLHYAAPALLAGAVAGAVALARWRWAWVLPLVGVVAVAGGISRGRRISVWAPEIGGRGFALLLVAALAGTVLVLAWLQPSLRTLAQRSAVAVLALAAVAIALIAVHYPTRQSTDPVSHWAATVHGATIAAWNANTGDLYGPEAHNQVAFISRLADGAAVPIDTCQEWMRVVRDGHFEYTAVIKGTAWARWQDIDPAFRLVVDEQAGATLEQLTTARRSSTEMYKVVGTPNVSCPGQVNTGADFWVQGLLKDK